jgi:signal transduction histidine kinase
MASGLPEKGPPVFKVAARTVLELGSELISTDIIAFYELIKNAFDAGSKTGVEIHFRITFRRNVYLLLRAAARAADTSVLDGKAQKEHLEGLKADLLRSLDPAVRGDAIEPFVSSITQASTLEEFLQLLDSGYKTLNTIEVSDTGSGMSLEDLSQHFLVIGTPSRKREVEKTISAGGSRPPYLGEKGIGRLSAMRLGRELFVKTARTKDGRFNTLFIDWTRFDSLDAMVEDIDIKPQLGEAKSDDRWSGTVLKIGNLSEDWTEQRLKNFAEYDFARLIDPFGDPKARPRIAIFWNGSRIAIPWMDRALLQHAHASVKGAYVIEKGVPRLRCTLEAVDLGFPHPREVDSIDLSVPDIEGFVIGTSQALPASALASVGPFEFEAYWYNRRRLVAIESIGDQRAVRDLQKKWSGILLFRDGFRVFPYGDDDDDWLALDRKALGRPGYTLNKTQFVGHVNISRASNPDLVDQTNREGLRAGPEQEVFIIVLQHIIQGLLWDHLRDVEKRYKNQPIDLGDVRQEVEKLETRARSAIKRIRTVVPKTHLAAIEDLEQAFLEFRELADRAQSRILEVEQDSRQMVQMAGVGLMVEVVAHELARASENTLQTLETLRTKDVPDEIKARLDTLRSEMRSVSKRLRILDPLSIAGRQRSEIFDLAELVEDVKSAHTAQFTRQRLRFEVDKPKVPIRIRAVKGMIVQILENLISNSVYWTQLRAAREAQYVPTIHVRIEDNPVTLHFNDNGRGVSQANREKVFRPFWSLKEKTKRRGLGLFIARECATYLGGTLILSDLADKETGRLHEFVLELPDGVAVR